MACIELRLVKVECPACGEAMAKTWMAGDDRFFSDMWQCACGLAAPLSSLQDTEKRQALLNRFQRDKRARLPGASISEPPPKWSGSVPPRIQTVTCPSCNRTLNSGNLIRSSTSHLADHDRFFDQHYKCHCGAKVRPRQATEHKPSPDGPFQHSDPDFAKIAPDFVNSEPDNSAFGDIMPKPLDQESSPDQIQPLWRLNYIVTLESRTLQGTLGIPPVWGDTQIRTGLQKLEFLDDRFPVGFHFAIPEGRKLSPGDTVFQDQLGALYQALLELDISFYPGVRRHIFAALEVVNNHYPAKSGFDTTAFDASRDTSRLTGRLSYLSQFLEELQGLQFIPYRKRLTSLTEIGTQVGVILTSELDLEPDEMTILANYLGKFRFEWDQD